MANLQVKNIPEALHRKLRGQAKRAGRTVRDLVLEAVQHHVSATEFRERLAKRPRTNLGRAVSDTLESVRAERDSELSR